MYLTLLFIALVIPNWVVPTLVGIAASGGVSYWLGKRYRSQSRLAFQKNDLTVVGHTDSTKSLGGIKILFNEVDVPRVVVTRLAVWNVGNTVVDGSQLATSAPLAFVVEAGASILALQIVKATNDANKCRLRVAEDLSRAFIEFDFLNEKDGALFQVTHTGAQNTARVTGSIKGISKGVEDWGDLQEWSEQKSRLANSLASLAGLLPVGIIVVVGLLFNRLKEDLSSHHLPVLAKLMSWTGQLFGALLTVLVVSIPIFIVYYSLRTRSRTIPKSLSRG